MRLTLITIVAILLVSATLPFPASAGQKVEVQLLLQGTKTQTKLDDVTCEATTLLGPQWIDIGKERFDLVDGTPVSNSTSPTGRFGCLFTFKADMQGGRSINIWVGHIEIGTVTLGQLEKLDYRLEIALTRSSRSGDDYTWRFEKAD